MPTKALRNATGEVVNIIMLDDDTTVVHRTQWDAMDPDDQRDGKYYTIEDGWSVTDPPPAQAPPPQQPPPDPLLNININVGGGS